MKMSAETPEEPLLRPRFRLFVPGTPKTHQQATRERLQKVSSTPAPSEAEEDPCAKKEEKKVEVKLRPTVASDPRFQQQNQTLRCFVMYTDFFRCEKILGEGHEACSWFKRCYQAICPNAWISHWDDLRSQDLMPWPRAYDKAVEEAKKRESNK
ncbi:cytochrome c oxidase subunit 6B1-like [Diachasmimorpha longicaudata]|uniref:cytochrome c oxidase subunit 6B1-like n=1 Tax=Diachasmimorpha longicaudata TaxID=58733 RepID=UPI0030B8D29E